MSNTTTLEALLPSAIGDNDTTSIAALQPPSLTEATTTPVSSSSFVWPHSIVDPSSLQCNLCSLNAATMVLIPVLVVYGLLQNGFAIEVLQSPFISDLPSQPIIKALLTLQSGLLITGPLYIWLTHVFGPLLTVTEVCSCFFLSWFHDFLTVTTSWLLVTWMMERAVSMGKFKHTWVFWRMRFLEVSIILVGVALIVTLTGGIYNGALSGDYRDGAFSMDACVPWLDMERVLAFSSWPRLRSILFSLAPCLALVIFLVSVLMSVYYLYFKMRNSLLDTNHYQLHLAMVRSSAQVKFVYTLVCACPIFFLTCVPIGLSMYSLCKDGTIQIFASPRHGHQPRHFFVPTAAETATLRFDFGGIRAPEPDDHFAVTAAMNGTGTVTAPQSTAVRKEDEVTEVAQRELKELRRRKMAVGNAGQGDGDGGGGHKKYKMPAGTTTSATPTTTTTTTTITDSGLGSDPNLINTTASTSKLRNVLGLPPSNSIPLDHMSGNSNHTAATTDEGNSKFRENYGKSVSLIRQGKQGAGMENRAPQDDDHHVDDVDDDDGINENGADDKDDDSNKPSLAVQSIPTVCALWMLYYSFCIMVVPLLLITEPLFRHEWLHTWHDLKRSVCCFCLEPCCCPAPRDHSGDYYARRRRDGSEHAPMEMLRGRRGSSDDNLSPRPRNPEGRLKTFVVSNGGFLHAERPARRSNDDDISVWI